MAKRLSHTQQPFGIHSGNSPKGLLLFGFCFVSIGSWISLIGLKIVQVDPQTVHAPYWLLTLIGAIFGLGGAMIWSMALRHILKLRRITKNARRDPNNPAMADYDWEPTGYSPPRWKPTFNAWAGFIIFSLFGVVSFWMSFGQKGTPWFLKGMSVLMGLIMTWVTFYALKITWHAFKYGKSQLVFNQFPYPLDSTLSIEIQLPIDLRRAKGAVLTLRHVEEFYEIQHSGSKKTKSLIQEVLHECTLELSPFDLAQWPRAIHATFQLPNNAQPTQLYAERPCYWHVELELDMPGLDFKQQYLVPIY